MELGGWLALALGISVPVTQAAYGAPPDVDLRTREYRRTWRVPVTLGIYTRGIQVAKPSTVLHPGVFLSFDLPRWTWRRVRLSLAWKTSFEHHGGLQQILLASAQPTFAARLTRVLDLELSLAVGGGYLRSLWAPYKFENGAWTPGVSEAQGTMVADFQIGPWVRPTADVSVGFLYGIGILYPFATRNGVPALPLTSLVLAIRWRYDA